jgi:hypothetical protein
MTAHDDTYSPWRILFPAGDGIIEYRRVSSHCVDILPLAMGIFRLLRACRAGDSIRRHVLPDRHGRRDRNLPFGKKRKIFVCSEFQPHTPIGPAVMSTGGPNYL